VRRDAADIAPPVVAPRDRPDRETAQVSYEQAVEAALREGAPMTESDRRVWSVYREYDAKVREAIVALEELGEPAIEALGKVFLTHRQSVDAPRIAQRIRSRLSSPEGAVLGGEAAAAHRELRDLSEAAAAEFAEVLSILGAKADVGQIRARILEKHDAIRNQLRSGDIDAVNVALEPFRVRVKLERGGPAPLFLVTGERIATSTRRKYMTLEEAAEFLRSLGLAR
jgi:hypothetical protein